MKKTVKKPLRIIAFSLVLCLLSVCLFSCNKGENLVKVYSNAQELAQVCGIPAITFVPEGYKANAFRTVYDCVAEIEYQPENSSNKNPVLVVLRAVDDTVPGITNLSGFEDTHLAESYVPSTSDSFVIGIETRDEYLACEWTGTLETKVCKFSLSMTNGNIDEFKSIIDQVLKYTGDLVQKQAPIATSYESAAEVSTLLGIKKMTFSHENFEVSDYRIALDAISETEYLADDGTVLTVRCVEKNKGLKNISGIKEAEIADTYTDENRTFDIMLKGDVAAVEFEAVYGGKNCSFALLYNGSIAQFKVIIADFLSYVGESAE